jgi:hypothetical protein
VWFQKHWVLPPEHHVTRALKDRSFDFRRLPNEEADLIASLLRVFKSIELVSIILRFVKPENYGIINPPGEKILDVPATEPLAARKSRRRWVGVCATVSSARFRC